MSKSPCVRVDRIIADFVARVFQPVQRISARVENPCYGGTSPQKHRPAYGSVSSRGEPPAGMLAEQQQEAAGVRGQSPCICNSKSECAIEANRPHRRRIPMRPCDQTPHPSLSHHRRNNSARTQSHARTHVWPIPSCPLQSASDRQPPEEFP